MVRNWLNLRIFMPLTIIFSSYIYFSEDVRATRVDLPVYIGSVPTEHLETFPAKLKECLKRIADEGIDIERMQVVINRDERQVCGFVLHVLYGEADALLVKEQA